MPAPKELARWNLRAYSLDTTSLLEQTQQMVHEYAAAQRIKGDVQALNELVAYAYAEYKRRQKQTEENQTNEH